MSMSAEQRPMSLEEIPSRVLQEGFGPGAWHGPDLKAALADVTPAVAFWRPAPGRHNIAEIALHHAFFVRSVRVQIGGAPDEPFPVEGEEWFDVSDELQLSWASIHATLASGQERLNAVIDQIARGMVTSPLNFDERLALVLGITCHAVYHAGQIQLIKRLREG